MASGSFGNHIPFIKERMVIIDMKKLVMKMPKACSVLLGVIITVAFLGILTLVGRAGAALFPSPFGCSYTMQMIGELAACMFSVILLAVFGYLDIIKEKGIGFGKSFYTGGFFIGYFVYALVAQLIVNILNSDSAVESFPAILTFVITMFLVGAAEELLFRGLILNLLLDRFSNTRRGILLAVLFDGLIFGCAHFGNLSAGVHFTSILIQVISAGLLGTIFAIVYARTGNIWFVILAHAAVDFAALLGGGIFGNGDLIDALGSYSAKNLITVPVLLIPFIVLCRKSRLDEAVQLREGRTVLPTGKDAERDGIVSLVLGIISIVISCIGMGFGVGIVGCIAAVISKKTKPENNGIAIAGLVTSIVGTVIGILMTVILLVFYASMDGMDKAMIFEQMGY